VCTGIGACGCAPQSAGSTEPVQTARAQAPVAVAASPPLRTLRARKPPRGPHPEMVEIRPSRIPGAGDGLFALVEIRDETYLGFYRGEKLTPEASERLEGTKAGAYLFGIPECAGDEVHDSIAGDMNDFVSKVNFAPRRINGQPTHLQNVEFREECTEPYIRLYSIRDIAAGEELYADYGPDYDYAFMEIPAVQNYLLQAAGIEEHAEFSWDNAATDPPG
jgi:hypothetical protein